MRSRAAASVAALGTVALVAPGVVAAGLALVPGLDTWPSLGALRRWGLTYALVGVLAERQLRRDRRVDPRRAGAIACVAALALFWAHLLALPDFDAAVETFSWSVAVVVPFVAGTPRSVAGRYLALGLLALPIAATRIASEPVAFAYVVSPLADATYRSLVGATFGLPLFALGGVVGGEKQVD
ncbi:hypothetical protein NGM10_15135 [Halorussus salilacus]|uniref:hypothetical protein n=1 Tax=Halorussus salilacus TaxID=2953750 RepID=UPI00209E586B|nr:hypothetical protein [Halorussus salilacus]USZ68054.1 hypothetical protein NGM10_15135 [Halorussus salilacus]